MRTEINLREILEERLSHWSSVEADSLLSLRKARIAQEVLDDLLAVILQKVEGGESDGAT